MAYIKEITYEIGATTKIREFEYCKPKISVTISLEPGDDESKIFEELTSTVHKELDTEIKKLKKVL